MKLATYRAIHGLTYDEMASLAGLVTRNRARAVRRWESGERVPRSAQMAKIVTATGGAVGPADFFDIPSAPAAQATAPGPSEGRAA
jgi:transcriptional regulator with XRE-family HTH domain